jgi:hypothetical protein
MQRERGTHIVFLSYILPLLYLAFMRIRYLLASVLLLAGCGGRSMSKHLARDLIMEIPQETLEKKDVEVVNITQVSGSEAIAETTLKAAFRLERHRGEWVVREVRLGHGQWEKVDNFARTLVELKIGETREMLSRIAEAIRKYRESNGALPVFKDYISLSDALSPNYLTPLIRLDSWRRPLQAERTGPDSIVIRSAGPDGKFGTNDDLIQTFP